ncbi:unnamed protein product [Peronospora effusa]|nr:unnamed protein product [Peronospora effusa]
MTRQGYLIVYDKNSHRPNVCYFSLEDGFLRQYASDECVKCLNEVQLSGCKVIIKAQKRVNDVPNSFYLETRKVYVNDRSYTLGNPERIEFSAYSSMDRQDWGKALFSWQRFFWREPQVASPEKSARETRQQLEQIIAKYFVQKPSNNHSISIAAAKQPISFLQRNAHSLQRSLMLTMASTGANNMAKPESDVEPTDCRKDKVALSKVECPVKSNNTWQATAVKLSYLPTRFSRGISQEAH